MALLYGCTNHVIRTNITYYSKYWIRDSTIPSPLSKATLMIGEVYSRILKEHFYINVKEGIKNVLICAYSIITQRGVWVRAAGVWASWGEAY